MIDKTLIKTRFSKSMKTYNDNAIVQKKMAKRLIELLPQKKFLSVFEIGSATGVLTKEIKNNLKFEKYTAIDLVEKSKDYINDIIPQNNFISGDIETIELREKYDLIISNAALQWCENIENTIKRLYSHLNYGGVLAVSVFASDNFKELKQILNIQSLQVFQNDKSIIEEEKLLFDSPLDVLKHIKSTGANAITHYKFTKNSLKTFFEKYKAQFSENGKVTLTYKPLYFITKYV